jgi:hypothetical protein
VGRARVNFALFSAHATQVELCLFDIDGEREIERVELPEYSDEVVVRVSFRRRPFRLPRARPLFACRRRSLQSEQAPAGPIYEADRWRVQTRITRCSATRSAPRMGTVVRPAGQCAFVPKSSVMVARNITERDAGQGTGAMTEVPLNKIREHVVLSNRDKAQHPEGRGVDGKAILSEQFQATQPTGCRMMASSATTKTGGHRAEDSDTVGRWRRARRPGQLSVFAGLLGLTGSPPSGIGHPLHTSLHVKDGGSARGSAPSATARRSLRRMCEAFAQVLCSPSLA